MWDRGERRIQQAYGQYQAPWKGHRLICLGDYVKDVPKHLNNAVDLCQFATTLEFSYRDCHVWFDGQNPNGTPPQGGQQTSASVAAHPDAKATPNNLAESSNLHYGELITDEAKARWERRLGKLVQCIYNYSAQADSIIHPDYDLLDDVKNIQRAKAWARRPRIRKGLDPLDDNPFSQYVSADNVKGEPKPEPIMILRNLTKRQYIRSDMFAVTGNDSVWGFGRAILSRICWSTDSSTSMRYEGKIHRGVWAGDRFDIIRMCEFTNEFGKTRKELVSAGWEDVTSDVREELRLIWKSQYFEYWHSRAW